MFLGADSLIFEHAKINRATPTAAEEHLWEHYLRHKPEGFKFRRQHPLNLYIADFYCHRVKLIIELDGSVHDSPEAQQADRERQDYLESQGLTILRFRNEEVMENIQSVMSRIRSHFFNQMSPL